MEFQLQLMAEDGIHVSQPADPKLYQQIVGSLQYAAGGTRPDIAYAVSPVAKFCNKPTELHLTAAKRVLRYLKQTRDLSLTYVKDTQEAIIGYRLGWRREGPKIHFWERVPTRTSSHHLVKQKTEFCCPFHGGSRIYGS